MQSDFESKFKQGQWSKHFVRGFLMAQLLIHGGGHRTDVVSGVTLGQWQQAQTLTNTSCGTEGKVIHVHRRTTLPENHTTAQLVVADPRVSHIIQCYVYVVRPEFVSQSSPPGNPRDPSLSLFLGRFGKKITQILGGAWYYIKSILRLEGISETELNVLRPKDILSAVPALCRSPADPFLWPDCIANLHYPSQEALEGQDIGTHATEAGHFDIPVRNIVNDGRPCQWMVPDTEECSEVDPNHPRTQQLSACLEGATTDAPVAAAPKVALNDKDKPILPFPSAQSPVLMRHHAPSPHDDQKKVKKIHFDKQQKNIILDRFKSHMISQKEIQLQCDTDAAFRTFWHAFLTFRNLNPAQGAKALRSFLTNRLVGRKK